MNTTAVADQTKETAKTVIAPESINEKSEKENPEKKGRRILIILTSISIMIMVLAVSLIYVYIRNNPELTHTNDQTSQVTTNDGFVNPDSLQKLEHDTMNITMKPVENSTVFIVCGVVMMVVMAGSFIFVKIKEYREAN